MPNGRLSALPVCLLALFAAVPAPLTAAAAEIASQQVGNRLIIRLTGQIENGDADRIRAEVGASDLLTYDDSTDHVLVLDSPGGSFLEGLRIADTLIELYVGTYVGDGGKCLSACALAFMGGTDADSHDTWQDRMIHPRAKLGFHAPSLDVPEAGSVPAGQIGKAYRIALRAAAGVVERMDTLFFKRSLLQAMLDTPPDEIRLVKTVDDAALWRIAVDTSYEHGLPRKQEINAICNMADMWKNDLSAIGSDEATVFDNNGDPDGGESVTVREFGSKTVFSLMINMIWGETCHIIHDTGYDMTRYLYFPTLASDEAAYALISDEQGQFIGLEPYHLLPPQTLLADLPPRQPGRLER